ncbi:MAG: NAD(P)-dependent glycerol-3-phosphate dehydrogenase [Candidatus Cloacimonetes bacterium]|nr:NAD(P)-dependent glycerol-3-phosphate dehydrogenase [Candidatus Cloacimonadota bacterium]
MSEFRNTYIIGSGNWGTCFAKILSEKHDNINLFVRKLDECQALQSTYLNSKYLPDIKLPNKLNFTQELPKKFDRDDLIILAIPTNSIRTFIHDNLDRFTSLPSFLNLSKGIEISSKKRISQILQEFFPQCDRIATLSGPNIAGEIALEKPAVSVVASTNTGYNKKLQVFCSSSYFRIYTNTDLCGVEIAGALKNIFAIGSGICHGLDLGDNAKSALMTRGIMEMTRFGKVFGADSLTFMGLAGFGDLSVTCMSKMSRNNRLGMFIAQGHNLDEALENSKMITEGVYTCKSVYQISQSEEIYMPITNAMHKILFEGQSAKKSIQKLMKSSLKQELCGTI